MQTSLLLSQFFRHPASIGSLVSSSPALAQTMVKALPSEVKRVVELGPGRGPITQALLDHGIAPENLLTLEADASLAQALRRRLPHVQTVTADARFVPFVLRDLGWPNQVDAVVSSLPLRNMAPHALEFLLGSVDRVLRPGGSLIQYTYGLRAPIADSACRELGWRQYQLETVWKNLPPARVFRFVKGVTVRS